MTYDTPVHETVLPDALISRSAQLVVPQPGTVAQPEELEKFTEGWLANRRLSPHTRDAYRRDVAGWRAHCLARGIDPLTATFVHVNQYLRLLEATINPVTGKLLTKATVARKASGISSWYNFLVKLGALPGNPVAGADRDYPDDDYSSTIGLSAAETDTLILATGEQCRLRLERGYSTAAQLAGERNYALVVLLVDLGLRVGEAVGLDIENLVTESERRTIRFVGKGDVWRRRPLTRLAAQAIDAYLEHRARLVGVPVRSLKGPLFVTAGDKRWTGENVFKVIRRLAREAGIEEWDKISPHSLRHAFATKSLDEGIPLADVQDAMGHKDPRTTQRYNRNRQSLDRDPALALELARARRGRVA